MNVTLRYKDTVQLVTGVRDMYGDITDPVINTMKGLFLRGKSESFQNDTYTTGTDAHIYLDPNDPNIVSLDLNLQGCYLNIEGIYGGMETYKIERVKIGQRKLLGNEINNIHCFLSKVDKKWQEIPLE